MGTTNNSVRICTLKWPPLALILMLSLIAIPATALAQDNMNLLRSADFDTHQRPPVRFEHDTHNEKAEIEECSVCHHVYEDGVLLEDETSEDEPCSTCHPARPDSGELALMRAFHKRCITCHDQGGKGPLTCGACHIKE